MRPKASEDPVHLIPDFAPTNSSSGPESNAVVKAVEDKPKSTDKKERSSAANPDTSGTPPAEGSDASAGGSTDSQVSRERSLNTSAIPGAKNEEAGAVSAITAPQETVLTVKPSFRVNDDSRIEITMSSHEFETSMAKNDFSSQSTEGSL